jgi:inner membrane protein
MDTGTHLVIGLGLAGLAHIDPVIAADPVVSTAVLIGTVAGQQAPDADTLLRLKGNATYIKHHRGMSHSLPAVGIWTLLITAALGLLFDGLPMAHVTFWVFLAVVTHVFSDLFNTYGTQAMRPITDKWIAWNIIHIFDPIIFLSHILAIFLWMVHVVKPEVIFPILYAFLAVYYLYRTVYHLVLERTMYRKDTTYQTGDRYMLIPTVHQYAWQVVKQRKDSTFQLGEFKNGLIKWVDEVACDEHPAVEASKQHPNIASFLYFSSFACAHVKEHDWGYEVQWADVRYRHRKQYPFVAVVHMNHQYETIDSYVGWLSSSRLEKRMRVDLY